MNKIAYRRKELNLSQAALASLCGVGRQYIGDIESGHYLPTPQIAEALQTHLKLTGLSSSQQIVTQREIHRIVPLRPFDLPAINREPWQRMHRSYPRLVRLLRLPAKLQQWMENNMPLDSAVEGYGLWSVGARGAEGAWCSPHDFGYRQHCLLDSLGYALGERLLPALRWVTSEFECILWPQPRLLSAHGTFRPDGLLLVKINRGVFWNALEVDGRLHRLTERTRWDKEREELLGLDFIRISSDLVLEGKLPDLLILAFRNLGIPPTLQVA